MRILVLNQYFYPDRAATGQLLTELCEDLAERHDVHVIAGRPSYNPEMASTDGVPGVRVTRPWSTSFDRAWMPGRLSNYASYLTASALRAATATRPDIVLAWTDPPLIGAVAGAVARIRRVPLVIGIQDVFPEIAVELGRLNNRATVGVLRLASRVALRNAKVIVSLGRDMSQRLLERGVPEEKLAVIPNWADGEVIKPLCGPSKLRAQLGLQDHFVVMHSGNVGLSQDFDNIVGAAALLVDYSDITLIIAGVGAAHSRVASDVQRLGLRNVKLIGYQPKAALSDSLGAADVHLVSLRSGLAGYIVPSKVYGIMAAGRPYIAAVEPWAEPALMAEEYSCGLRVGPSDPRALAAAILTARQAPLPEMGARARRAFEQHYERRLATARYSRLLSDVVNAVSNG